MSTRDRWETKNWSDIGPPFHIPTQSRGKGRDWEICKDGGLLHHTMNEDKRVQFKNSLALVRGVQGREQDPWEADIRREVREASERQWVERETKIRKEEREASGRQLEACKEEQKLLELRPKSRLVRFFKKLYH